MKKYIAGIKGILAFSALACLASCGATLYVVSYTFPSEVTGATNFEEQHAAGSQFDLPSEVEGSYAHHSFTGWSDVNGNDYEPGASITMGDNDITFTAIFSLNEVGETYCVVDNSGIGSSWRHLGPSAVPMDFLADKSYSFSSESGLGTYGWSGTWDYSPTDGLTVNITSTDGSTSALAVTDAGDCYTFQFDSGGFMRSRFNETIDKYSLINNYNKEFGTSYTAPTSAPVFSVSFSSGADDATGTDPTGGQYTRGQTFALPDNPYSYRDYTFDGWDVDGVTYQPGSEVTMGLSDLAITPVWDKTEVLVSSCEDTFFKSGYYSDGIPLTFYEDGSAECNGFAGSWSLADSVLSVMNKENQLVKIVTESDGTFTYDIDTLDYYWGAAADGNKVQNHYTHTFTSADFVAAYNTLFGASITSITVVTGTADFD